MFSDPKVNLEQFGLEPGMKVADLGAGAGFYAMEASKLVGMEGKVFCIDVQKEILAGIGREAEREDLDNIEVIWGDIEKPSGTKLKDATMDACIVSNILFQLEDRDAFIIEVGRILKEGGRVLVVDWLDSFRHLGPHKDKVYTKENTDNLFLGAGFTKEKEIDAGDQHYGIVYKKV